MVFFDEVNILELEAVIRTVGDMRIEREGLFGFPNGQLIPLF